MAANEPDPVERQVEAYNRRDIDAFLACYAPDTVVENATGTVVMRGDDETRVTFSELFRGSPDLRAEIATRIRVGEYVIDEERITGRRGAADEIRVVAIYHLKDGVIDHVQLIR